MFSYRSESTLLKNRLLVLLLSLSLVLLNACGSRGSGVDTGKSRDGSETLDETGPPRKKIIAFGDSLTAGFGLSEKESYPYLLQKRLRADGFDYEVIDAGVSGDTSLGGLERIDWVLDQDNVRILILELGANDLLRRVPVANMRSNLEKIILKAKRKKVDILLCGMLAPESAGKKYQKEFAAAFSELATAHELRFLPFLLENVALDKELNQSDGIHPNAKGTEIMTDNVYRELRPMLTADRGSAED